MSKFSSKVQIIAQDFWQFALTKLGGPPPTADELAELNRKFVLKRYLYTLIIFFQLSLILLVPELINYANSVPDPIELKTHKFYVVETHQVDPHFLIELRDGSRYHMEWPIPLDLRGKFFSNVWTNDERKRLPGCLMTVRWQALRWTINNRHRIWELDCPEKGIHIGMDKVVQEFQTMENSRLPLSFFIAVILFATFSVYMREKRGNIFKEKKSENKEKTARVEQ